MRGTVLRKFQVLLLAALPIVAASQQRPHHETPVEPQVLAPGYSALEFPAPEPGTYSLPALGEAADGRLLDSAGSPVSLHDIYDGKIVVLSFIYTSCPDVNGCPLATFVLGQVRKRLEQDALVASRVHLVSVSFDPANDPPEVMKEYGGHFRQGPVNWRFLTADSEASISPVLEDYDQSVIRDRGANGETLTTMSHILRVYLIDADKRIRNIYSPSYLHPDILYADIRTVMETDGS